MKCKSKIYSRFLSTRLLILKSTWMLVLFLHVLFSSIEVCLLGLNFAFPSSHFVLAFFKHPVNLHLHCIWNIWSWNVLLWVCILPVYFSRNAFKLHNCFIKWYVMGKMWFRIIPHFWNYPGNRCCENWPFERVQFF